MGIREEPPDFKPAEFHYAVPAQIHHAHPGGAAEVGRRDQDYPVERAIPETQTLAITLPLG